MYIHIHIIIYDAYFKVMDEKCERNEKQKFLNNCGWKTSILGGGKLKCNIAELHLKTTILICKSNIYKE